MILSDDAISNYQEVKALTEVLEDEDKPEVWKRLSPELQMKYKALRDSCLP